MTRTTSFLLITSLLALLLVACQPGGERADTKLSNHAPTPGATNAPLPTHSSADDSNVRPQEGATAQQQTTPPRDVVSAEVGRVEIRAGGTAEAQVLLHIAAGYHINANPPTHKYLIATQLDVTATDGITVGKPVYPQPISKKFAFDASPLNVYETEAKIRLPLTASSIARKGEQTLAARVRVQPCDEQACYPPRTIETAIPLQVN